MVSLLSPLTSAAALALMPPPPHAYYGCVWVYTVMSHACIAKNVAFHCIESTVPCLMRLCLHSAPTFRQKHKLHDAQEEVKHIVQGVFAGVDALLRQCYTKL